MSEIRSGFTSIEQVMNRFPDTGKNKRTEVLQPEKSFSDFLGERIRDKAEGVRFSKHAALRLSDRGIDLSEEQTQRLNEGVRNAKEKGIQESLVLMDSLAFIVNTDNQTVITAMDRKDTSVFTNIDGAVIV
ncbi:MAG: flagellar protein [Lachnospiraceae bacterium]|nr:flagellar protein [Lachnospiraceae bacterium]MCR4947474.1 flagellar protein [Lachnospiraceae bacterium]